MFSETETTAGGFSKYQKILSPRKFLIAALVMQVGFSCVFAFSTRGTWLRGDNYLYETPAWNLVSGNGLTISRAEWEDPYLTELYYAAHPERNGDEFIPAATFPSGYSYFLATVYFFTGRSQTAAVAANLILLLLAVGLMYRLAQRTFGEKIEFYLTMILVAFFPLWAFWTATIISDILHLFLLLLFAYFLFTEKLTLRNVIIAGVILGLAAIVRPYAILLPTALWLGGLVFHCRIFNLKNTAILTLLCCIFLGGTVLNNYYLLGKPIVTSKGLGDGLWLSTQKHIFTDDLTEAEMYKRIGELGVSDFHRYYENQILLAEAIKNIKSNPGRDAVVTLTSIPRLWLTLGSERMPGAVKIILLLGFGSLFCLMLFGIFLLRKSRNPVFVGAIVITIYFTIVFAHLNVEGRYVLPARFFSFLLIAAALGFLLRRQMPQFFESPIK